MWVQLLQKQQIEQHGEVRWYHPGDWVEVGRDTAVAWIAQGRARVKEFDPNQMAVTGAGVVVLGDATQVKQLDDIKMTLAGIQIGGSLTAFQRTLIWEASFKLRLELVHLGFRLLDTWQMAVPLVDYKVLASGIGTEEERARTQTTIRDLRVMVYDHRLMFVKDAPETRDVLDRWQADVRQGDHPGLALLQAIYTVKPLICALPVNWTNRGYVG